MVKANDTRDRLLEAALLLIWEESLGAASVDAICEKAGVRKGSFYHFFKSRKTWSPPRWRTTSRPLGLTSTGSSPPASRPSTA
jgi:TetR/AcrR family transcriptional repressor of nem operon